MTTKITEQNISNISNAAVQWQSVVTADGSTATSAVAGYGYFIDTTSAAHTVNLPNTASVGDTIILKDYAGTWGTNNVTISSTLKISGADADGTLSTNNTTVTIVYMDTTKGWTPIQNSTQSALAIDTTFISATGGTVTTSGNYTIHTFTGDGCFVVTTAGTGAAPSVVDYLVVAGGGGGGYAGGGGAGAGGFRMSNSTCMPAPTTSPLANPTGVTVSATTYPVTVGAGGATTGSQGSFGGVGSNSIFSTITSAGGGGGAPNNPALNPSSDKNGGSGSGAGEQNTITFGSGNTPPVSPPQGNPGGGAPINHVGGGGGGAGAAGSATSGPDGPCGVAGPGGIGSYVLSTGFAGCNGESGPVCGARYFAGGGGGNNNSAGSGGPGGAGGVGGGGDGTQASSGNVPTKNGVNNTGGGGGAGGPNTPSPSGAGGKGIVIIRYKSS